MWWSDMQYQTFRDTTFYSRAEKILKCRVQVKKRCTWINRSCWAGGGEGCRRSIVIIFNLFCFRLAPKWENSGSISRYCALNFKTFYRPYLNFKTFITLLVFAKQQISNAMALLRLSIDGSLKISPYPNSTSFTFFSKKLVFSF